MDFYKAVRQIAVKARRRIKTAVRIGDVTRDGVFIARKPLLPVYRIGDFLRVRAESHLF